MSAILGDEMGLGKTIQAAVFMQASAGWLVAPKQPTLRMARLGWLQPHRACSRAAAGGTHALALCTKRSPTHTQVARELGLTTGPVAVVVPLSTFGSWERELAK